MDDKILILSLLIVVSGAVCGWHAYLTQPVQIHVDCWEDPAHLNQTQWGNHAFVQLDTYTPRWRAWTARETAQGVTEVAILSGARGSKPTRLVLPNFPRPVEEAAYFYGYAEYTDEFVCERGFI